ncbi:hypothetical protein GCM10007860_09060 [Chitiniphilus shinanonensis]|uniref:Ice-binding protein C-terminal domain-containing protein n=1 Tax=Chitiniphilus shinanonensis TaxID=553088 RepID=A0ABQ6BT86_9NEIS|nr:PEP-CTERM sorting domain-containing protein [Chitiniphilus shinanonensis]GLS03761.1 hypothetical protein GCM10007860_09060 [Chitiniphilus shinanonensis]
MKATTIAFAAAALLGAASANAAVYQHSANIQSNGAWASTLLGSSANQFSLSAPGQYEFSFELTPNQGSASLASLQAVLRKVAGPGPFIEQLTSSNVGDNSFAGSFTFNNEGPGLFDFYLAFTNYAPWSGTLNYSVSPVPEPATLALFGLGAAGVAWRRRKQRGG